MTNLPERRLLPERAIESFDEYVASAGGQALAKALTIRRERIIADIKRSGLRGRGGGGGDRSQVGQRGSRSLPCQIPCLQWRRG